VSDIALTVVPAPPITLSVEGTEDVVLAIQAEPVVELTIGAETGPQGLTGATGPAGTPGATSGDLSYRHVQSAPAVEWVIPHELGKYPALTVLDSAGTEVVGNVLHDSLLQARVFFTAPFAGIATAN
jgi:hypothetical protein